MSKTKPMESFKLSLTGMLFSMMLVALVGCSPLFGLSSTDGPSGPVRAALPEAGLSGLGQLSLALTGLPVLPAGFVYEGWVITPEDEKISTGRFSNPAQASVFQFEGDLAQQRAIVITLETGDEAGAGDANGPAPDLPLLSGAIVPDETTVELSLAGGNAANPGGGVYLLATPTDNCAHNPADLESSVACNDQNDQQGIWYLQLDPSRIQADGAPPAGLRLALPSSGNFEYEGWVVNNADGIILPVTTGKFADPNQTDFNSQTSAFDGGIIYLGPPRPGEDYVNNKVTVGPLQLPFDLNNGQWVTVISIEPRVDPDPGPFVLKPLASPIALDRTCLMDQIAAQADPVSYQQANCGLQSAFSGLATLSP